MNELISISANILYERKRKAKLNDPDVFARMYNISLVTEKVTYVPSSPNNLGREVSRQTHDFVIKEENFDAFISNLLKIQRTNESLPEEETATVSTEA